MKKLLSMAVLGLGLFIAGCSDTTQGTDGKESVSILYPSWAEGVAMTHFADVVLTAHDVDVTTTLIEPGPLYASLAKGDADLYLDAWLPNTHFDYWERFGKDLDKLSVVFDDASTGLVVPDYVEIDSIDELNDNVEMFGGKIYGIGSGAGIHTNTIKAIDVYGLDYEQITSSESSMMAELRRAINAKEPVIVTGWKPHYKWDLYDLKMLKDPKTVYEIDEINVLARKGFKEDKPALAVFFQNFELDSDKLHELMGMVRKADQESNDPKKGAAEFYEKYKTTIDGWFNS